MAAQTWVEGKVVGQHQWTDKLFSIKIEAEIDPFTAGQFTRIALDIDGKRVFRPYSFVNAPDERPLELYYITVPEGPLTTELPQLKPNDNIFVARRGGGIFTLQRIPDADQLWMLATGTALGPFLSILKTPEPWARFKQIVLAHGVRTESELAYQEEIIALQNKHSDQLKVFPFVSREKSKFALPGRITTALKDGSLEKQAGMTITPESAQVMLCGNPAMVHDTNDLLHHRGLKRNMPRQPGHITMENYWK